MSRRACGMSVSLDPALRVPVRPEGVGNLQVFSQGWMVCVACWRFSIGFCGAWMVF